MSSTRSKKRFSIILIAVAGLAIISVGVGLSLVDSPSQERKEKQDLRTIARLEKILGAIEVYWDANFRLPETMDDLVAATSWDLPATDAGPGERLEFQKLDYDRAELCGFFLTEQTKDFRANYATKSRRRVVWTHDVGRMCFPISFRPDRD